MADQKHLESIKSRIKDWNEWRKHNPEVKPNLSRASLGLANLGRANLSRVNLSRANLRKANLSGADLSGTDLRGADLRGADLSKAKLREANLARADLSRASLNRASLSKANLCRADLSRVDFSLARLYETNLSGADLSKANFREAKLIRAYLRGTNLIEADFSGADLRRADLSRANLSRANLSRANLSEADLSEADLREANLSEASLVKSNLVETKLLGADLSGCNIYGISAWNIKTDDNTKQKNLIITKNDEAMITVDNLEVAQFIYIMLNNKKIRDVINTISNKAVLILGKFGTRFSNLEAIRVKLRESGLLPILFDFEKPSEKDTAETIIVLAGLAKFVIADLTEPRSIPLELKTILSNLPTLPVHLLLQEGENTFGMVDHIVNYNSISGISRYKDLNVLLDNFQNWVLTPVEEWRRLNRDHIEAKLKMLL